MADTLDQVGFFDAIDSTVRHFWSRYLDAAVRRLARRARGVAVYGAVCGIRLVGARRRTFRGGIRDRRPTRVARPGRRRGRYDGSERARSACAFHPAVRVEPIGPQLRGAGRTHDAATTDDHAATRRHVRARHDPSSLAVSCHPFEQRALIRFRYGSLRGDDTCTPGGETT